MIFISIIIPTWKRKSKILRILNVLKKQKINKSFEIIISDSNTLGLHKSLKDYKKKNRNINLKYLNTNKNSNALKRNLGIKISRGKYIIFLDDDCLPEKNFLCKYISQFKSLDDNSILCGSVKYQSRYINKNNFIKYRQSRHFIFTKNKFKKKDQLNPEKVVTMNMAFKKTKKIEKTKYFNEKFSKYGFEDYEFAYRLIRQGFKIFPTKVYIIHLDERNLRDYLNKIYYLSRFSIKYLKNINNKAYKNIIYSKIDNNIYLKFFIRFKFFYFILKFLEKLVIFVEKIPYLYLPYFYRLAILSSYCMGIYDRGKIKKTKNNWYK